MESMLGPNRVIAKDFKSCTYCCYVSYTTLIRVGKLPLTSWDFQTRILQSKLLFFVLISRFFIPKLLRHIFNKRGFVHNIFNLDANIIEDKTVVDNAATNRGNAHNMRNPSAPGAGRGITRSNSAKSVPSSNRLGQPSTDDITKLLFKSQSTVRYKI